MIEEESSEDLQVPLYWLGKQEYAKAVEPSTAGPRRLAKNLDGGEAWSHHMRDVGPEQ